MENMRIRLERVRKTILDAEVQYNLPPGSVTLLAVSKLKPVAEVMAARDCGQLHFAENYTMEALEKIRLLNDPELSWHFIGPLQSNKTRAIAENFHWVHSLDRVKLARRLNDARPAYLPPLNVCIQINISGEQTKAGITTDELPQFFDQCRGYPHLRIRGLMALPKPETDFEQQRKPYSRMRKLFDQLRRICPDCDTLSMGTSADMRAAIAEGSTMVRIGEALFGPRE